MQNRTQLIAYVDRLPGGTFGSLQQLLDAELAGAFGGVHVLPFFHPIDGADAGFDPIDHTQVDRRLGAWDDVAALASRTEVMADVIVNHMSRRSAQFVDYDREGEASPYGGMFLTYSRVFPNGAREADLLALHTPSPRLSFTRHRTAGGQDVLLWTTFTSEQIDLDVGHPETRRYLSAVLERFHTAGIRAIRLDAVGFAVKKAGTSSFMIPETLAFIGELSAQAHALGMEVLLEVHGHHRTVIDAARRVDWVYDFALPPLVLHALFTRDATPLVSWLTMRPRNSVTVLDTHDGIGVQDVGGEPSRPGLLPPEDVERLVVTIHERSRGASRLASGSGAGNVDAYQVNCTFFDALGGDDEAYLTARALQCFVPGVPQIYYVGLLAGRNDLDLLRRTGVGRDINRRYYSADELRQDLRRPVVQSLLALLRLRNSHAAFGGSFAILESPPGRVCLEWTHQQESARLDVDLATSAATVTCSIEGGSGRRAVIWRSTAGG
jgi:sucrose phosphorylase